MKLGMAASYFNTIMVDGWDNTAGGTWVRGVSRGTLQVYDRFVSDRTFGEKKRIFAIGEMNGILPAQYSTIRLPDGKAYMVEYLNRDVAFTDAYIAVYVLHEATFRAEVYQMQATPLPSGLPGQAVRTLVGTYWGDIDKFSSVPTEFDQARRETEALWLERGAVLTSDMQVDINGVSFLPREISKHADLTFARIERLTP